MKKTPLFLIILFSYTSLFSQNKFTINGNIKDKAGEDLIGATIYIPKIEAGAVSNVYGFFSITLPEGKYQLVTSYVGYESVSKEINLTKNITLNIVLEENEHTLEGVEITAERTDKNVREAQMSTMTMKAKDIKNIPAFMGEVDVIKAIQMMPGVQSASEGSSGFNVRGGSIDQNLILLDEATVYNASHLMGFFSIFNNDAIKDVKLYKGDIPASEGGRLSSLLDIRMKEGSNNKFHANGGIGTISSRLTLESPIVKDKSTFIISGRRSYADLMLLFANDDVKDNQLYFYDLNMKTNFVLNKNNRFYLSAYAGRDVMSMDKSLGINWGNKTITTRWNHLFSNRLFSNLSFVYSNYDYELYQKDNSFDFRWTSDFKDVKLKESLIFYLNPYNTIKTGFSGTYHYFNPGWARDEKSNIEENIEGVKVPDSKALSWVLFASNEWKPSNKFTLIYGLRFSAFHSMGKSTVYHYNDQYVAVDSTVYKKNEIYNSYYGLSPRVSAKYQLNNQSSLKASYMRTNQYVHLASNSTAGSPLDIWLPSSPNIRPQIGDQVAVGYFRNFLDDIFETSVEVYYKSMKNQIDFKDHPNLLLNTKIEGEMRIGEAWSYGIEFFIRKQIGKYTGWVSYTLSKTEQKNDAINNGKTYPASYDKPHNISVIMSYEFSKRITTSVNWVYSTGNPVTFPVGRFEYNNTYVPIYSERNEYRMPNYHRLDLSVNYKFGKLKNKLRRSELNLSIYNVYNRKNAWSIIFQENEDNPGETEAIKTYLFPILPSLTYNFYF